MNIIEIIKKKRDKKKLSVNEINFFITKYTHNLIPDYQISALLMALYLNGMDIEETSALTKSMLFSGKTLSYDFNGYFADKHSTGGVGDKTSLIIAPIVAEAGIFVPMISGRGLGHTGGTLDKLESVPGFTTNLSLNSFKEVLYKNHVSLIGQTEDIAPADKKLYSLRDVTGTVEFIPFITASIMSKKIAEGINGLVFDVKTGSGAFMKSIEDSKNLGYSLMKTAEEFNIRSASVISDMNSPLGINIGNWLEVEECVEVMQGKQVNDLVELSLLLSGILIYFSGKAGSLQEGNDIARHILTSGRAFNKFLKIIEFQKGDIMFIKNLSKYDKSKYNDSVFSACEGYINFIDTYEIGMASLLLGAGRLKKEDKIDYKAGIKFFKKKGDSIKKGEKFAELYTDNKEVIETAKKRISDAVIISEKYCEKDELVNEIFWSGE